MPLVKFSKASSAVIKNKRSFFEENEKHLRYVRAVNRLYVKQPPRTTCKTCSAKLLPRDDILVQGVGYVICDICGHFNGRHEDTAEFAHEVYAADSGENYAVNYKKNFTSRVSDIYIPKAEFLRSVLKEQGLDVFNVTDVGCGGGHFVAACEALGIFCTGYDTNQELIELGSSMLNSNKVVASDLEDVNLLIASVRTEVLSLIGVLEHLMEPRRALESFVKSDASYLYLQVPLFSLSVLLESAHPNVFPRQLNAGHTHLYTESSLNHLKSEFGLESVGEWWFGTDMVDLFRHLSVLSKVSGGNKDQVLSTMMGNHIDALQSVLDEKKLCSGVNLLLKKH